MTREVQPITKEAQAHRVWTCKWDSEDCTRSAPCNRCRGARNRRSGMRKQRATRKALEQTFNASAAKFVGQLGNEEAWHGLPVMVEAKSGAQVGPIWTRFLAAESQAHANRAVGDVRPFVMVAMPKGVTDGLVLCRLSQFTDVIEAAS